MSDVEAKKAAVLRVYPDALVRTWGGNPTLYFIGRRDASGGIVFLSDNQIGKDEAWADAYAKLPAPTPVTTPETKPETNWMLMVDEVVCDYGPPEYRMTEDGEAWYWGFSGFELPVADNLSELLIAAAQLTIRARAEKEEVNGL